MKVQNQVLWLRLRSGAAALSKIWEYRDTWLHKFGLASRFISSVFARSLGLIALSLVVGWLLTSWGDSRTTKLMLFSGGTILTYEYLSIMLMWRFENVIPTQEFVIFVAGPLLILALFFAQVMTDFVLLLFLFSLATVGRVRFLGHRGQVVASHQRFNPFHGWSVKEVLYAIGLACITIVLAGLTLGTCTGESSLACTLLQLTFGIWLVVMILLVLVIWGAISYGTYDPFN